MDNFKVSSFVPVSCKPLIFNVILCPVEQKKVRIRHKLLYVKYRKPICFEDFTLLFDRPEKLQLTRQLNERSKHVCFALTIRATCTSTCRVSAVAV